MSARVPFSARLLTASVVLFLARSHVSAAYGFILHHLASRLLPLVGERLSFALTGASFVNVEIGVIPLLALMLATPSIRPVKRASVIATGVALLLLSDLAIILLGASLGNDALLLDEDSAAYTLYRTALLAMPPILWVASCYGELKARIPFWRDETKKSMSS